MKNIIQKMDRNCHHLKIQINTNIILAHKFQEQIQAVSQIFNQKIKFTIYINFKINNQISIITLQVTVKNSLINPFKIMLCLICTD